MFVVVLALAQNNSFLATNKSFLATSNSFLATNNCSGATNNYFSAAKLKKMVDACVCQTRSGPHPSAKRLGCKTSGRTSTQPSKQTNMQTHRHTRTQPNHQASSETNTHTSTQRNKQQFSQGTHTILTKSTDEAHKVAQGKHKVGRLSGIGARPQDGRAMAGFAHSAH